MTRSSQKAAVRFQNDRRCRCLKGLPLSAQRDAHHPDTPTIPTRPGSGLWGPAAPVPSSRADASLPPPSFSLTGRARPPAIPLCTGSEVHPGGAGPLLQVDLSLRGLLGGRALTWAPRPPAPRPWGSQRQGQSGLPWPGGSSAPGQTPRPSPAPRAPDCPCVSSRSPSRRRGRRRGDRRMPKHRRNPEG